MFLSFKHSAGQTSVSHLNATLKAIPMAYCDWPARCVMSASAIDSAAAPISAAHGPCPAFCGSMQSVVLVVPQKQPTTEPGFSSPQFVRRMQSTNLAHNFCFGWPASGPCWAKLAPVVTLLTGPWSVKQLRK
jgi:hypothetical protein